MIEQIDMPEAVFERPTTFRAIRHYWYLVFICAVLGAACGGVFAFKRAPIYTATARLSAISIDASNVASLSGSLQAAEELASTFARVVAEHRRRQRRWPRRSTRLPRGPRPT